MPPQIGPSTVLKVCGGCVGGEGGYNRAFSPLLALEIKINIIALLKNYLGFPGGTVIKNSPANAGDRGSIPGPGRSHMPRNN